MGWMVQASTSAGRADQVFLFVFALSVIFLVGITATMIYFVVRYDKKRHPRAEQIEGNALLEIVWTVIPLVLFLVMFYYGWTNFAYMRNPPRDAMAVRVTGRQWNWSFEYPNGKQTTRLFAALGRPMKLELRSPDVVHGFYIPAFRLKQDVVPGRVNTTWFQPTLEGSYDIECTVICGTNHSQMLSKAVVVSEEEFKAWYFGDDGTPEPGSAQKDQGKTVSSPHEPRGLQILRSRRCLTCHSTDGRPMTGPTFRGFVGARESVIALGKEETVTVDEAFIRKSIEQPHAARAKGYPAIMPTVPLTADEMNDVVEYLKSLK